MAEVGQTSWQPMPLKTVTIAYGCFEQTLLHAVNLQPCRIKKGQQGPKGGRRAISLEGLRVLPKFSLIVRNTVSSCLILGCRSYESILSYGWAGPIG